MLLDWLNARDATRVGAALADHFVTQSGGGSRAAPQDPRRGDAQPQILLQKFLQQVDRESRSLELNLFKRAKLANSFKWRLLEKGIDKEFVEELTEVMVRRLTINRSNRSMREETSHIATARPDASVQALMRRGAEHAGRRAHVEAVSCYEELLRLDPRNAVAHNNLGVSLCSLGRYAEAWQHFRQAIGINESYPDAQVNLGSLLRFLGRFTESEQPLRRALKLRPGFTEARVNLGATLSMLGRLSEAKELLETALRAAPRHVEALQAIGQLLTREGRFAEAETFFRRALEVDPYTPQAWVGLAGLRRMSPADGAWLKGAQQSADSGLQPLVEASVRYAIGKYYDEVGDFQRAFRSVQHANELVKTAATPYDREASSRFVDDLMRSYPGGVPAPAASASDSALPVFVVGMPRSGTTLVAQIIDAHPQAKSAGEVEFWGHTVHKHMTRLQHEPPDDATRRRLAEKYLRVLTAQFRDARRVVDKSPFNSDILGIIHAVLPHARFIYVQRDPIDTCLSCYFQNFPPTLNFTQDLSDLAHYYRQHRRLIEHWRGSLPAGTVLDVPYEELVADQEGWTRRIMEFLGLEWTRQTLDFDKTDRLVLTASFWQVRQQIYTTSVGRWRNYEKFIRPLLSLKDLS